MSFFVFLLLLHLLFLDWTSLIRIEGNKKKKGLFIRIEIMSVFLFSLDICDRVSIIEMISMIFFRIILT